MRGNIVLRVYLRPIPAYSYMKSTAKKGMHPGVFVVKGVCKGVLPIASASRPSSSFLHPD